MAGNTAEVVTMTAEVRVLRYGARQVTQAVFKQLDVVSVDRMEPLGRVNVDLSRRDPLFAADVMLIGRHKATGALVRGGTRHSTPWLGIDVVTNSSVDLSDLNDLPTIILAG